jgi:hypothetical protein
MKWNWTIEYRGQKESIASWNKALTRVEEIAKEHGNGVITSKTHLRFFPKNRPGSFKYDVFKGYMTTREFLFSITIHREPKTQ